jgi:hypothetical protein
MFKFYLKTSCKFGLIMAGFLMLVWVVSAFLTLFGNPLHLIPGLNSPYDPKAVKTANEMFLTLPGFIGFLFFELLTFIGTTLLFLFIFYFVIIVGKVIQKG